MWHYGKHKRLISVDCCAIYYKLQYWYLSVTMHLLSRALLGLRLGNGKYCTLRLFFDHSSLREGAVEAKLKDATLTGSVKKDLKKILLGMVHV